MTTTKNVIFVVAVICVIVSVNAQLPQFPTPFPFPFPGASGLPDITKFWKSLMDIPGCVAEISQSLFTGRFGSIGPACCKTVLDAEATLIVKLPFNPFFPPTIKDQCLRTIGATPPTTK